MAKSELLLLLFLNCAASSSAKTAKIFVVGGANGSQIGDIVKRVDIYDFETSTWSQAADLPEGRRVIYTGVINGLIYAVAGVASLRSMFSYDPKADQWSLAPSMTTPRRNAGYAVLSGKFYVIGGADESGHCLNSGESFDPNTQKWTPIASMNIARSWLKAAAIGDRLYALGGVRTCPDPQGPRVEVYDPNDDHWSAITSMTIRPLGAHCVAILDNKLYAIGSGGEYRTVEVYDPQVNSWSDVAELSTLRAYCGAVAYDGLIYVLGGCLATNWKDPYDTIEVYYPQKDDWSTLSMRMPTARAGHGVVLVTSNARRCFASFLLVVALILSLLKHCH